MTPEDRNAKLEAQIEKLRADQERLQADQAEMNKQVADAVRTGMQSSHDDLRETVLGSENKT